MTGLIGKSDPEYSRHCPSCQQYKAEEWLNRQMENLMPTHYFLLTITLPQGLREVARSNQKIVYRAMFECAHEALKKIAKDKRFVGSSRIGYLAVLHTWGSMLQYHPHLHLVIPGGAVSKDGTQWLPSREDLFVHTKPFTRILKGKFKDAMKKAKLFNKIDSSLWRNNWVVHSQAAGKGENALRYLARYVFRVAISNNRIKSIGNDAITEIIAKIPEIKKHVLLCPRCKKPLRFTAFLRPVSRLGPAV